MYILTISGKEAEGAYAVENEDGEKTLFMFEEQDDAERYAMMLSMADEDYPVFEVVEVEEEVAVKACEMYDYPYVVISSTDLVIPKDYDKI